MFAKYIEIYTTLDMEKYFRVKNLLAENNISYKDTSTNNQLRLSLNNLRGDNPVLLRDSSIKNTYSISVKKEDEQKARQIIQNTTGTSFSKRCTNPSFSEGIILIMRSWTELSAVLTMRYRLRFRIAGFGHDLELQ